MDMDVIENIFRPDSNIFTVFVVEQRFVVGRGHKYFQNFINKPNFFDTDEKIKKRFKKIIMNLEKNVAPVSKLVSIFTLPFQAAAIPEIITSLCKLFTVSEHQAAGPDVIDPIIIQEGEITRRAISKLVNIHKDSILQPSIIILLRDNDFDRAKKLLSDCPDGINVKMIRNNGKEEIYRVINCGADNIDSFMLSFSDQCYSTCSKTKRDILLNANWSENKIISKYSPRLLKYRTNLIFDEKEDIKNELSDLINEIISERYDVSGINEKMLQTIECTARLYRVFCNDYGGKDIVNAEKLATNAGNEVLLAQVYRYAEFLPNCSEQRKSELYDAGYSIFRKFKMDDQAIYCKNNKLIQQFYSDRVYPDEFRDMQIEAINSVPGLVGMSHIYNNAGVAYLYCGQPSIAVNYFNKGLDYAMYQDRIVQNLALESNKVITESYSYTTIDEYRLRMLMRRIFDGMGISKLPFISADFALNIISVAYKQNPSFGNEIINDFNIKGLIEASFRHNSMGASERVLQLQYLASNYQNFPQTLATHAVPKNADKARGKRMEFIVKYGFNPFDFNTWL